MRLTSRCSPPLPLISRCSPLCLRPSCAQPHRHVSVGGRPGIFQPSAFEKAFPHLNAAAPPSCEQAYEGALHKPKWSVNADVEVSFFGKGFEGSWAAATIVLLDGRCARVEEGRVVSSPRVGPPSTPLGPRPPSPCVCACGACDVTNVTGRRMRGDACEAMHARRHACEPMRSACAT